MVDGGMEGRVERREERVRREEKREREKRRGRFGASDLYRVRDGRMTSINAEGWVGVCVVCSGKEDGTAVIQSHSKQTLVTYEIYPTSGVPFPDRQPTGGEERAAAARLRVVL